MTLLSMAMLATALVLQANPAPAPTKPAAQERSVRSLTSYTANFATFVDETASLPEAERVRLFKARFDALLPGFYEAKEGREAQYDTTVANALRDFPRIRAKYGATADAFAEAFATGQERFRRTFPDYRLNMPVYLVHSLGQMDGGTRTLRGRDVLVFGADVIAKIHDETTIGPFLDHELFHVYHGTWFPDCEALWCSLWQEGLAVYVASRLNPGASERQLLLNIPQSLPVAVDPRLKEAMCLTRANFNSAEEKDYGPFFFGQPNSGPFPPRFGYYVGYLLAKKIGTTMTPSEMAHLSSAKVKPLLEKALAEYGACASPAS